MNFLNNTINWSILFWILASICFVVASFVEYGVLGSLVTAGTIFSAVLYYKTL